MAVLRFEARVASPTEAAALDVVPCDQLLARGAWAEAEAVRQRLPASGID